MKKTFFFLVVFGLVLSVDAAQKVRLSLSETIKQAISNNSELKMKDQDIAFSEGRLKEVRSYMFPSASNLTTLAPINRELGDALNTTGDYDKWGPWVKSTTTIIQPLYAYGKIKFYTTAANGGIEAEKEQKNMKKAEVIFDVKQYYYSAQAADGVLDNINESEKKLKDVIKRVDDLLKAESGEVRKQDAYKLKAVLQELKQKKEFVVKGQKLARSALAFKAGYESLDTEFDIKDAELKKEPFKLESLEHYQKLALEYRPEFKALEAGITARQALVDGEKTNLLPVFFLGALIDVADMPNDVRTRQGSSYAYDPYNGFTAGIGLGAKWNLDIWKVKAKVSTLKAEYFKLVHQKELAHQGIPLEVKKAYLEYQEALNNIGHATEELDHSKKWFLQSVMAWGFGVGDSREVLESVIFKGLADKAYTESLLNHNIAIASLSRTTGTELLSTLHY